jgi:hypothetical protein
MSNGVENDAGAWSARGCANLKRGAAHGGRARLDNVLILFYSR